MGFKGIDKENISNLIGWSYVLFLLASLTILPWWQVIKIDRKIVEINNLQKYNDKLIKDNEKILNKLYDVIEARDLYANKYCLSVNFSTTECKQMLKEKIKQETLLTTELDAFKKELTQNSSDKTSLSE